MGGVYHDTCRHNSACKGSRYNSYNCAYDNTRFQSQSCFFKTMGKVVVFLYAFEPCVFVSSGWLSLIMPTYPQAFA